MDKIMIRAAELVEEGLNVYSCNAVDTASERLRYGYVQKYAMVMSPWKNRSLITQDIRGAVGQGLSWNGVSSEMKEFRILLLLFAAAAWGDL